MNLQTKIVMNVNVNAENAIVEANVNVNAEAAAVVNVNARIAKQRLSRETYRQ